MSEEIIFEFNEEKNRKLKVERGICFLDVIVLLDEAHILDVVEHPNKERYPKQKIYIMKIDNYAYLVPFVKNGKKVFLKTIIPSRKATAQYITGRQ